MADPADSKCGFLERGERPRRRFSAGDGRGRSARRRLGALAFLCATAFAAEPAVADCKLMSASLAVTMLGLRPLASAKVNGADATFLIDSGAVFSLITPANASRFHLPLGPLPFGMAVGGVTGLASAGVGTVDVFTLADTPIHRLSFIITGGEMGEGAAGAVGQNILGGFDVDYDLAHGAVRLLKPKGCGGNNLAYWAGDKPVSIVELQPTEPTDRPHHASTVVYLNGVRLRALLDTGSTNTIISIAAAARAGVTSHDPGVLAAGRSAGIGRQTVPVWVGLFKSFKIGGEEIKNTKMAFGGVELEGVDMLLGADFFLSHHVLVSNSQSKIYFTYNGGPIFMLNDRPQEIWGQAGDAPPKEATQDPSDAAGFAGRGAASAARHDYTAAVADLTQALASSPANTDYLYERGRAYMGARQPFLAMSDFDQALKLKPDDVPVLIERAQLKLRGQDTAGAVIDLDAAAGASAKQDDRRLRLGQLYEAAGVLRSAVSQYDLWLAAHPEASETPIALSGRCRSRALLGQDLEKAMADCNQALRSTPANALTLDARGLIHLRQGDLNGAARDYTAALAADPKLGRAYYGRGLAKRGQGDASGGAADIAAALAINPKLTEVFRRWGLET